MNTKAALYIEGQKFWLMPLHSNNKCSGTLNILRFIVEGKTKELIVQENNIPESIIKTLAGLGIEFKHHQSIKVQDTYSKMVKSQPNSKAVLDLVSKEAGEIYCTALKLLGQQEG